MGLLTDDQKLIQDTARGFLAEEGSIAKQLRHWRDSGCSDGFGTALWKQFGELGLTGICIPEGAGGAGMGATEAGLVLEEIGRNLTPSPFLTTAVAAVRALEGSAQAERWFPGILAGEAVAALAVDEGKHHAPAGVALEAKRSGNGFAVGGAKQFVVHGAPPMSYWSRPAPPARRARREGITLFAVEKGAGGLDVENVNAGRFLQSRAADVRQCRGRCRRGRRRGRCGLGAIVPRPERRPRRGRRRAGRRCRRRADMTFDYLKQRKQFGRLIGEFQALQHRAAHLYGEIEIARAAAFKAAELLDSGDPRAELMVSVAKAKAGRSARAGGAGRRADARRHRHDRRA